ncbi:MAG: 8-amino-7-oxononanoate synthase [Magnetococcales bacterium]|nr:8-amino-7-oxononanoate synthase [Magnetococcales bacterium]
MILDRYENFLAERRAEGLERCLRWSSSPEAGWVEVAGKRLLNLSGNDYLGLSRHPLLLQRAREWGERWGTGSGASRLVTGNLELFRQVEEPLAALHGSATALIFNSGFQANSGILPALLDAQVLGAMPLVFSDRLVHASIHQGCRAAGVRQLRYRHNDMNHLEHLLSAHAHLPGPRFILTESLFSMEGDVAPMGDLLALKERFGAFLYLDEAHAVGVMGREGRGVSCDHGGQVDLILGTFGKALGSFGAYVACSEKVRQYLINRSNAFIYSTALPPTVLGSMSAALELLPALEEERQHLMTTSGWLRQALRQQGWDTAASCSQIIPVITQTPQQAMTMSQRLQEEGILGVAIRPPTVPTSRLRLSLSALHQTEQLQPLLAILSTMQEEGA